VNFKLLAAILAPQSQRPDQPLNVILFFPCGSRLDWGQLAAKDKTSMA